eukprot:TRINITY_DN7907_c0_g1_i1.p1 TRINITY_DN7907_c0_g1~~TRINITY_DN7907_c0_g1_i1.p1  ORF type:complete len:523 (-),score=164.56 TRINITY_DN7907_c0_g1_i1:423-1991(-)
MTLRSAAGYSALLFLGQGGGHDAAPMGAMASVLTVDSMNPLLGDLEYAVRGAVPDRALELDNMIKANPQGHGLPFNKTIQCNIGNPQALGQKPLSFNREVISMVTNPNLLEVAEASKDGTAGGLFKADAVRRARVYLDQAKPGIGAYTHSMGFDIVRREIAEFIEKRDGYPSNKDNIFVTDGASAGVRMMFNAMIRPGGSDSVLVPIPQYPLYSALTALFDGHLAGYYLDEDHKWGVTIDELQRAVKDARSKEKTVKALVIINPGNPTGQCLDEGLMKQIVELCMKERLVLMADEVYQENVYAQGKKFTSFKKVVMDMGAAAKDVELVSFHSASKGFLGECGVRGGYMELHNIDKDFKAQLLKLASITLCSNTVGQLSIGLMVNPPKKGEESHSQYIAERDEIITSLGERASKLAKALNKLDGVTCNPPEGAMYLFPQIYLPKAFVKAAEAAKMVPDTFYCLKLLEATGIATVPGSGFKQKDGTFHLRTTFLPPAKDMDMVIERFGKFHGDLMASYGGKDEL